MGRPAQWLWDQLGGAFRGALTPSELALLVGRFAAWHLATAQLPSELQPPMPGTPVTGTQIREVWSRLSDLHELGDGRLAFANADSFPYAQLSDSELSNANQWLSSLVLLDQREGVAVAEMVARALLKRDSPGGIGLPLEVANFLVQLLQPERDERIFCPGPATDAFAIAILQLGGHPVIVSPIIPVAACLYGLIARRKLTVIREHPFQPGPAQAAIALGFEKGAVSPPFGSKPVEVFGLIPSQFGSRSSEAIGAELLLRSVRTSAVAIVPNSFLFSAGADRPFREHLVDEGKLSMVISFPPGLLTGTVLPFSALLLSPKPSGNSVTLCKVTDADHVTGRGRVRAHDRRFIGAERVYESLKNPDGEECIRVTVQDIRKQEYNLIVDRYLAQPFAALESSSRYAVPLGDIVEIIKPQFLAPDESASGVEIEEAIPSEMPAYGYLTHVERRRRVDETQLKRRAKQILQPGDVLLSTKGTIGTVSIAEPQARSIIPLLPSQASVIMRLKHNSPVRDPRYLVMFLKSPAAQRAMAVLATGATIQNIALGDLRALSVWVPDAKTQARFIELFEAQANAQKEIDALLAKQRESAAQLWRSTGLAEPA